MTVNDSLDPFYGLNKYNSNARTELERLQTALNRTHVQLETAKAEEEDKQN